MTRRRVDRLRKQPVKHSYSYKHSINYKCPRCGAEPGVACRQTNSGYVHQHRHDVARMLDIVRPCGHTAWPVGRSPGVERGVTPNADCF